MYYPSSENKGADQLRSYCEADLRLCFRIGSLLYGAAQYDLKNIGRLKLLTSIMLIIRDERNLVFGFPTRPDTNRPVQSQKARDLTFVLSV